MKFLITQIRIRRLAKLRVEVEHSDHKENRNPLNEHRYIENESLVVNNEIIHEIAPGIASSILKKKCEYLSFAELFSRGKFGYLHP